jgi:rubrerythrin
MMASKKFQRCQEDFTCLHCGARVRGTGYTNHCPHCLWSRHVDINPGDRASNCLGLMEPIAVQSHRGTYRIIHRCQVCGLEKPNKLAKNDNFEAMLQIMAKVGE